ncbi:MAG TPA: hypothetical protein VI199_01465, partial [Novosphingobium sp.]
GVLPYVDVWDRKPPGLFLLYGMLATLGTTVWIYQVAACLAAAATALLVARLVERLGGNRPGGLAAGLAYLFTLLPFGGDSGQAPDLYNPLVAAAALLVVGESAALARARVRPGCWAAMALCGLAISIKQTAAFESAFLGLWLCGSLLAAGVRLPRLLFLAAGWIALGLLPMLSFATFYAVIGHFPEFRHAMVGSNFAKARVGGEGTRAIGIALRVAPLAAFAVAGTIGARGARRGFLDGWLLAALAGFLAVPNFYGHYLLPMLVPLCVAAGLCLSRSRHRWLFAAILACWALVWESPPPPGQTRQSRQAMTAMAAFVRAHDPGGGLLVFDGPPLLYAASGERFLTPLVFPNHLDHAIEADVSHLATGRELARVLARHPGVIAMAREPRNQPVNADSYRQVTAYIAAHCPRQWQSPAIGPYAANPIVFAGDCR